MDAHTRISPPQAIADEMSKTVVGGWGIGLFSYTAPLLRSNLYAATAPSNDHSSPPYPRVHYTTCRAAWLAK